MKILFLTRKFFGVDLGIEQHRLPLSRGRAFRG